MVVCTREISPQRAQMLQRVTHAGEQGTHSVLGDAGHIAGYSSSSATIFRR